MLIDLAKVLLVFGGLLSVVPVLIYLERKICAFIQDRIGPNRVGPYGLLQPLADAIKLILKEDITPLGVDRLLYTLAPVLAFVPSALAFAAIPFGNSVMIGERLVPLQIGDLDVGVLFVVTVSSLSVYGIAFGGWASNNKWSLLGAVRSSAQMISYEVAMGLALIAILMVSGSISMDAIVRAQTGLYLGFLPAWNIFTQPIAFVIFLVAAFAETNRLPFDLAEAEPELVAGYHTEYSSMKFAMFFMGEYLAVTTFSALLVTLFLGGWSFPGIDPQNHSWATALCSVFVFGAKTMAVLIFYIFVRWTLPRFRYDQLMNLGWKGLIPLGLANVAVTGVFGVMWNG